MTKIVERIRRLIGVFGRTIEVDGGSIRSLVSLLSPGAAQTYAPFSEISGWERPIYQCICLPASFETGDTVETVEFNGVIEFIEPIYVGEIVALIRLIVRIQTPVNPLQRFLN